MKRIILYTALLIIALSSCTSVKNTTATDDGRININFVQLNDVYEIAPLAGGTVGGMARVASIKNKYLKQNPNTFLVMAGDFLSPSVYNSLKYQGKAIRGKQMIDAMNAAGMDFAIFGNHEFDIKEIELQERINESHFQWISSNTFHRINGQNTPFIKTNAAGSVTFPTSFIKTISDADGTTARIGIIAITLPFNKAAYVGYTDPLSTAKEMYNKLKDSVDVVIALTHQSIEDDEILAKEIPGLAAILGGHEHEQQFKRIGHINITKAMANAKSAFVITMAINKNKKTVNIITKVEQLNENVALDSSCNTVVQHWVNIAESSYASLGFDAKKIIIPKGEPLDGREIEVRNRTTNLTRLIVASMASAAPKSNIVILNAGSIRVDDIIQIPVTQYDIIRSLPFGGSIREVDMKGSLLIQIFENGLKNKGIGGFLHYNENVNFDQVKTTWKIGDSIVDPFKIYRVAMPDFLLTGGESNLGFLKPDNKDILKVYDATTNANDPLSDVRLAIIKYLEK